MNGGVLWGRPRAGRGCSAIYGMEISYEGGQGLEGAVAPYREWNGMDSLRLDVVEIACVA